MLPKNRSEPMGAPAIFDKQIESKLLHPAPAEEVTNSGNIYVLPNHIDLMVDYYCSLTRRVREQN
ncbi:MAG: hypothetical protein P8X74_03920 [Reinekea sp.]